MMCWDPNEHFAGLKTLTCESCKDSCQNVRVTINQTIPCSFRKGYFKCSVESFDVLVRETKFVLCTFLHGSHSDLVLPHSSPLRRYPANTETCGNMRQTYDNPLGHIDHGVI